MNSTSLPRLPPSSLLFISPKPTKFTLFATTTHTLKFNSYLKHKSPIQETQQQKSQNHQVLTQNIKLGNIKTISQFNSLFMGLVSKHELDLAYNLYSSLSSFDFLPNSLTFSILVHYYCKKNEPMEGKKVLEHMIENGFDLDFDKVKIFTQIINCFCKKGKLKQAFEVLEMMDKVKCEPTINTYNCLLKGLCYVGRVEEAFELLTKIKKSCNDDYKGVSFKRLKLRPDVYSYTAVMDGFCKVGRSNEALELLNEAIEIGLSPSIVCYNTIFNGYFKEGRPMEGFSLLKEMKERNCEPDYVSYSTLLHGLLQWGEIKAGVRVYDEMMDMGFAVDERMMNTLLRGVCRKSRKEKEFLKDAYRMFDEMCKRGCEIDPCAYELMIEAFCNGNEMDRAFVNLYEMLKMGLAPRTFTLNIVVKGLCVEGKIEKAMSILVLACQGRSEMVDRVAFDALINEMNRQGMVTDASCVYCAALKNGVTPLRKPIVI
uniref:pentatricopeptide repeat-containing protein At1g62670, mitochondrial-like n=1 Tax=Erigeron canadensis TaxID=72917 RepID=UPI001CB97F5C|nr:pentatricopeptide repeat-containing protein At1g62670, mitochondrial-like [Erigeron canadensis]